MIKICSYQIRKSVRFRQKELNLGYMINFGSGTDISVFITPSKAYHSFCDFYSKIDINN